MANSFSIQCPHDSEGAADIMLEEIRSHTGSEEEAISILRSIERFGMDASIGHYEVTPTTSQRSYRGTNAVAWSVRAVRASAAEPDAIPA